MKIAKIDFAAEHRFFDRMARYLVSSGWTGEEGEAVQATSFP